MLKKLSVICFCVVLMMASFTVAVSAARADVAHFTLSVTEGSVGDTVTLTVSLSENSYFTNTTFYLHYDATKVSFVEDSLDLGSAAPAGKTMFDARDYPDRHFVKGAFVTIHGIEKAGEIIKMDFKVLDAAPAAFSLSFDECVGVDENDAEFDVNYQVTGCVLNNDGSVTAPTGEPVVEVSTTATAVVTTTTVTAQQTPTTTMPTMTMTDAYENVVTIPVATATDANGNVTTMPVVTATDAHGAMVTVPVVVATDAQGDIVTIPVANGTDAQGNDVTIPVAIVTDEDGHVQTVPVVTSVDADGNIVTVPVTTTMADEYYTGTESDGLTTGVIVIVIGAVVAIVLAIVAMKLRKKNEAQ